MDALDHAVQIAGSASELARQLGVSRQAVHQWRSDGVPIVRCLAIERLTDGKVRCSQLRPDVEWPTRRRA